MFRYLMGAFALLALVAGSVAAQHAVSADSVTVKDVWARATAGGATAGAAYATLSSAGGAGDRLVSALSPVAGKVELHTMSMEGDVMRMRQVPSIDVNPGATVELKPGGLHIMLLDLKAPLKVGDTFPLTLMFEKSGAKTLEVQVRPIGASSGAPHGSMQHGATQHGSMHKASPAADRDAITKVMMATWDRADERLSVDPVTLGSEYALAGWTQGDRGGRALLRRGHGGWTVHVCGGDHLLDAQLLRKIGVSDGESKKLIADQKSAERKLPAKKVAMFSLFDSLVEMDAAGHHPPAADHGHHKKGHH